MAGRRTATAAAEPPDDLSQKRSALSAVAAEVDAEGDAPDDGSVTVTLTTDFGFHDFRVPPPQRWRSVARHALQREDDLTWAQQTLTPAEALRWMQLNPTMADASRFFEDWTERLGQSVGEARASRTPSTRTRGR